MSALKKKSAYCGVENSSLLCQLMSLATKFYKTKSLATAVVDLQYTLESILGRDQDKSCCALKKLAEQVLRYLQEKML